VANPNRPAFKKTNKKLSKSPSWSVALKGFQKADIIKYNYSEMGSNHGQKMTKRANQSRVAEGVNPVPVYKAGDAAARRAELLNITQFKKN
jgi:hypothetical protein